MRLIDADAIELPKGFFEKVNNVPKFYEWLNTIPTIDPVVRCKDCRYWGLANFVQEPTGWCGRQEKTRNPDWYCADGERKWEW